MSGKNRKFAPCSPQESLHIDRAPDLLLGGCHGDDEKAVFEELCSIVEEMIAHYHSEGRTLPPATSGKDFANRMQDAA
jgi:hypothetical protein